MERSCHITALLLSLFITACDVEFDISGLEGEPILYIEGSVSYKPGEGYRSASSLTMTFYPVPASAGNEELADNTPCLIEVYHNSTKIESRNTYVYRTGNRLTSDNLSLGKAAPGDELELVVNAEGYPTAVSNVRIPNTPPQPIVSHERVNGSTLRISTTINDDPETDDAYVFTFRRISIYVGNPVPDPVHMGTDLELSFYDTENIELWDLGPFEVSWRENGIMYYGVSDKAFNGKTKTFTVNADYPSSYDGHDYYRIGVHKVSPEKIRYEASRKSKNNNMLGVIGLAPPTYGYTNIIGGTGCFSCTYIQYTDWIPVPPVE